MVNIDEVYASGGMNKIEEGMSAKELVRWPVPWSSSSGLLDPPTACLLDNIWRNFPYRCQSIKYISRYWNSYLTYTNKMY